MSREWVLRTQDEIVARIRDIEQNNDDIMEWRRGVLVSVLDFEHAREFLAPVVEEHIWDRDYMLTVSVNGAAEDYLRFAVGKILAHRSISASRSVNKLREYAWLLGQDDVVDAMDAAPYPMYGAPKVKAFADGMGWSFPNLTSRTDTRDVNRMAEGLPCRDVCVGGCFS